MKSGFFSTEIWQKQVEEIFKLCKKHPKNQVLSKHKFYQPNFLHVKDYLSL